MNVTLADLHRALEHDEVVPYFQPQIDLRTGCLTGFEVLARWENATLGPILPANFIELAEQNGLIGALTRRIIQKTFLWTRDIPKSLGLAVNISPIQLRYQSLCSQIFELAKDTGFSLDRLTIEITESAMLDDLEAAFKITRKLKAIGCRLSLDDFGIECSSLRHLQALPFDQLKIDKSFVSEMVKTRGSRKIVATIVGLAESLGLQTVGEGVETAEQADLLLCLGCELGQGWLYGRAEAAAQLPDFVSAIPKPAFQKSLAPEPASVAFSLEALPSQRLAQMQAIYDGVPVGLCFLDRNLRYVSINRRLAEMNGYSASSFLGRTVQQMIPKLFPGYKPYLLRALNGEAITGVEVIRPASGPGMTDRISLANYQPAFDEAGEVIGISVAVLDITEQEEARQMVRAAAPPQSVTRSLRRSKRPHPGTLIEIGTNLIII